MSWWLARSASIPTGRSNCGRDLRLDPTRCYTDYRGMAQAEATRPDGAEVVSVVTPNVSHHAICKTFLEAGIDVICDKPLATNLAEAKDLLETVRRTGRFLGVTYNYSAYPMMREARALIAAGTLGPCASVQIEFGLGWLSTLAENDSKQARWRTDPIQAGPSLVTADLGTHCFHLAEFVTRRRVDALSADLAIMVKGRRLEDNAQISLRFDNGARGAMWVSMVAAGEQVGLRLARLWRAGAYRVGPKRARPDASGAAGRGRAQHRARRQRAVGGIQAGDAPGRRPARRLL